MSDGAAGPGKATTEAQHTNRTTDAWAAIVRQAQLGDHAAFERLVERFRERLLSGMRKRLAHYQDAEEVTQETFVQAWRELPRLRDPSRFPAWLHRIARTRGSNFRARWRQETLPLEGVNWSRQALRGAGMASGLGALSDGRLRDALNGLSDVHRQAASLFYVEGYSVQEVAARLTLPAGTVKRRLHDARVRLRELYGREDRTMAKTSRNTTGELRAPAPVLLAALQRAAAAVADESRPALSAVVVRWDADGITFAASDGFRMAEVRLSPNAQASATAIAGIPPAWEEWHTRVRVETTALRHALRAAEPTFRGGAPLLLDSGEGVLRIYAKATQRVSAYETSLPATLDGTPQRIAVNGEYLLQTAELAMESRIELSWGDPSKPMIVREIRERSSASADGEGAPTVIAKWALMPMTAPRVMEHEFVA